MFPLGAVALPGSLVPLHIFEPRYRQLAPTSSRATDGSASCLSSAEARLAEARCARRVGTRMRVTDAAEFQDGRWAIMAVGEDRIRVTTWLPDDPYPMALVETLPAGAPPSAESNAVAESAVRRALGLAVQLGYDVPPVDDVLVGEPTTRQWLLAGMTPCGPADRQRILAEDDAERRGDAIATAALDAAELFELQLHGKDPGKPRLRSGNQRRRLMWHGRARQN